MVGGRSIYCSSRKKKFESQDPFWVAPVIPVPRDLIPYNVSTGTKYACIHSHRFEYTYTDMNKNKHLEVSLTFTSDHIGKYVQSRNVAFACNALKITNRHMQTYTCIYTHACTHAHLLTHIQNEKRKISDAKAHKQANSIYHQASGKQRQVIRS